MPDYIVKMACGHDWPFYLRGTLENQMAGVRHYQAFSCPECVASEPSRSPESSSPTAAGASETKFALFLPPHSDNPPRSTSDLQPLLDSAIKYLNLLVGTRRPDWAHAANQATISGDHQAAGTEVYSLQKKDGEYEELAMVEVWAGGNVLRLAVLPGNEPDDMLFAPITFDDAAEAIIEFVPVPLTGVITPRGLTVIDIVIQFVDHHMPPM